MSSARRVEVHCPDCDQVIATAPREKLPVGELVCPKCRRLVRGPGRLAVLIERAIDEVHDAVDTVIHRR